MKRLFQRLKRITTMELSDELAIRAYYSLRKIFDNKKLSDEDPIFLSGIEKHATQDEARQIAAVSLWDLIRRLPLSFPNYDVLYSTFARLGISENYETVCTLYYVLKDLKSYSLNGMKDRYKTYCSLYKTTGAHSLSYDDFFTIANCILFFEYDGLLTAKKIGFDINSNDIKSDKLLEQLSKLANDAYLTRNNRLRFVSECVYGTSITSLISDDLDGDFKQISKADVGMILSDAKKTILESTPLECLKRLFVIKQSHFFKVSELSGDSERHLTGTSIVETNTSIEHGILYRLVNMDNPIGTHSVLTVVDATPFLVETIVRTEVSDQIRIVCTEGDEADLLEAHYGNPTNCKRVPENVTIYSLDESYLDEIDDDISPVLIIQNQIHPVALKEHVASCCRKNKSPVWVLCDDITAKDIISASNREADVFLLPINLWNSPEPKKKTILRLDSTVGERITVSNLKVIDTSAADIQNIRVSDCIITCRNNLLEDASSLRSIIRKGKRTETRKKRKAFWFSPEISFVASVPNSVCNDKITGKAYFVNNTIPVTETKASYRERVDDVERWITTIYPYKTISKRNGDKVSVRSVVGEILRAEYKGLPLSLRTIEYIYPELKEYIPSTQQIVVSELINSEIGVMNPAIDTMEEFETAINTVFKEKPDSWKAHANNIIARITDFACEKGHVSPEKADEFFEAYSDYKEGRANISKQLVRRSLNKNNLRKLVRMILEIESNSMRIIFLLRLVTGVETEALCGLLQSDYLPEKRLLVIRKVSSFDGADLLPTRRKEQKRIIPCTDTIAELIENHCLDSNSRDPLFCIDGRRVSPMEVKELSTNIVSSLGMGSPEVNVLDARKKTKRIDLSEVNTDLLRGNFSFWARYTGVFFEDEVRFILGIRKETTDGIHYIDFEASDSQERIRRNLTTVESLMLEMETE